MAVVTGQSKFICFEKKKLVFNGEGSETSAKNLQEEN
jgi:hypothetical protein